MNINKRTRTLIVTALLAAITFLLGLTPIGYIPLPTMKITILVIPVIIGVMMEGLSVGLFLGFVFGVTSLLQVFMGDPLGLYLMNISPIRTVMMIFIPRLLVPVTAYISFKGVRKLGKLGKKASYLIGAGVGSITNTFFFLGMLYLLFIPEIVDIAEAFGTTEGLLLGVIGGIALTNGVPEMIAAMIIVPIICLALNKVILKDKSEINE